MPSVAPAKAAPAPDLDALLPSASDAEAAPWAGPRRPWLVAAAVCAALVGSAALTMALRGPEAPAGAQPAALQRFDQYEDETSTSTSCSDSGCVGCAAPVTGQAYCVVGDSPKEVAEKAQQAGVKACPDQLDLSNPDSIVAALTCPAGRELRTDAVQQVDDAVHAGDDGKRSYIAAVLPLLAIVDDDAADSHTRGLAAEALMHMFWGGYKEKKATEKLALNAGGAVSKLLRLLGDSRASDWARGNALGPLNGLAYDFGDEVGTTLARLAGAYSDIVEFLRGDHASCWAKRMGTWLFDKILDGRGASRFVKHAMRDGGVVDFLQEVKTSTCESLYQIDWGTYRKAARDALGLLD